jgi:hypothetical protein
MVGAPIKPSGPPTQPPQKPRVATPQREAGAPRRNGRPGPVIRIAISVWILWHFAGVFLAALSIGVTSPLVMNVAQTGSWKWPMQWYLDALYLNQGHSFFAPDVGPGHIISYELFDQSNRVIEKGTLPDKKEHWSRLFYHRHMMLADQADIPSDDTRVSDNGQRMYLTAYAHHLLRTHKEAQAVRVQRYAHWPLPTTYLVEGRKKGYEQLSRDLSQQGQNRRVDEQGYEKLMEVVQRRSDLGPEANEQQGSKPPWDRAPNQNLNSQIDCSDVAGRWNGGPLR